MNQYKPIKIELENIDIEIPKFVNDLKVSDHPISKSLYDLYNDKEINVIGLESEIMDILKMEKWNCKNIIDSNKKVKEKNMKQKVYQGTLIK